MAVTVTTNTLSSRVRYLNVSGSTANADAKDVILAMAILITANPYLNCLMLIRNWIE